MRSKLTAVAGVTLLLAVSGAIALAQQEKILAPKYELPEVTHAEEVIYPVKASLPGTVVLQVSLDQEGRIEETGTHAQLAASEGLYARIYRAQRVAEMTNVDGALR